MKILHVRQMGIVLEWKSAKLNAIIMADIVSVRDSYLDQDHTL